MTVAAKRPPSGKTEAASDQIAKEFPHFETPLLWGSRPTNHCVSRKVRSARLHAKSRIQRLRHRRYQLRPLLICCCGSRMDFDRSNHRKCFAPRQ